MILAADDQIEILGLYARYNSTIDAGDAEGWVDAWVDDGSFTRPDGTITGHAELAEFVRLRAGKAGSRRVRDERHWNRDIELETDGAEVRGGCRLMLTGIALDTDKTVVMVEGTYGDVLVRGTLGWKFSSRVLSVD